MVLGPGVCSSERINGGPEHGAASAVPVRYASVTVFSAGNAINRSSGDFLAYSKSTAVASKDPIGRSVGRIAVLYFVPCVD
jgi:hypothetical protein